MTIITNAYINALLADAAYVNVWREMPQGDLAQEANESLTPIHPS